MSVNSTTVIVLGQCNPTHDCNVKGLFISGTEMSIKYFCNDMDFFMFRSKLDGLKGLIARLNHQHRHGIISDADYHDKLLLEWLLGLCAEFIDIFGAASVPLDVRRSIDEVSAELDTDIVESWPPIVMDEINRSQGDFHIHFVA